jgi:hypothetical protein
MYVLTPISTPAPVLLLLDIEVIEMIEVIAEPAVAADPEGDDGLRSIVLRKLPVMIAVPIAMLPSRKLPSLGAEESLGRIFAAPRP